MVNYRSAVACLIVSCTCLVGGCHKQNKLKRSKDVPSVVVRTPDAVPSQPSQPEREPNDTLAAAQVIGDVPRFRIAANLVVNPVGQADVDYYRFVIPGVPVPLPDAGEDARQLAVRLYLTLASQGPDLQVTVLDDGKPVTTFSCERGKESVVPNLAVLAGRAYVVRVKAAKPAKGTPGDAGVVGTGYFLSGELGQFGPGDEREPNDSQSTAESVRAFSGAIERAGYLSPTRDEDWYRIPLPSISSVLGLDVAAIEGVGVGLRVVDGRGAKLGVALGNRNSEVALRNVALPAAVGDAGATEAVFAVVRLESGQNPADRYVLHLTMGPVESGMEVEPNDVLAKATDMEAGAMRGYLSRGDVDMFRYKPVVGQGIRVTVIPPARVRVVVEVARAGDGLALGRQEGKSSKDPVIVTVPNPLSDSVFIRITPKKGEGNPNQPYSVGVVSLPGGIPTDSP